LAKEAYHAALASRKEQPMPPLPVITDVFRCAINWQSTGGSGAQTAENVIHILAAGKTAAQVGAAIDGDTDPNMFLSMSSAVSAPSVSITPLDGTSATLDFPLTTWVGTAAGDFVPAVSQLLSLQTAVRGRSHRGRIYVPFTTENRVSQGFATDPTNPPAQAAAWLEWAADILVGGFTLVVASYKLRTAAAVTNIIGRQASATQRRRQERNQR
jgi:hypothetical protein